MSSRPKGLLYYGYDLGGPDGTELWKLAEYVACEALGINPLQRNPSWMLVADD